MTVQILSSLRLFVLDVNSYRHSAAYTLITLLFRNNFSNFGALISDLRIRSIPL